MNPTHGKIPDADAAQQRALELLRRGQRFLLCGHVRPDGDCLGAQAALARVLRALGKEVWIVNADGSGVVQVTTGTDDNPVWGTPPTAT